VLVTGEDSHPEAGPALQADIDALTLALEKLGVVVREEALPEASAGGLARVGSQRWCFVPRDAGGPARRTILVEALRRMPTEDLFLHPRVRALLAR
jgi:hypothetical protein